MWFTLILGLIRLKPGLDVVYTKTRPNKTKSGLDLVCIETRPNETKAWVRCCVNKTKT